VLIDHPADPHREGRANGAHGGQELEFINVESGSRRSPIGASAAGARAYGGCEPGLLFMTEAVYNASGSACRSCDA
jgi:pyruvate/2-oxoacid:ferredoxin oxidoreductase alpha subunit